MTNQGTKKQPKSFRFDACDIKKLSALHTYYSEEYKASLPETMQNLYKWSEAQTIALLIRERYEYLLKSGKIKDIEEEAEEGTN